MLYLACRMHWRSIWLLGYALGRIFPSPLCSMGSDSHTVIKGKMCGVSRRWRFALKTRCIPYYTLLYCRTADKAVVVELYCNQRYGIPPQHGQIQPGRIAHTVFKNTRAHSPIRGSRPIHLLRAPHFIRCRPTKRSVASSNDIVYVGEETHVKLFYLFISKECIVSGISHLGRRTALPLVPLYVLRLIHRIRC